MNHNNYNISTRPYRAIWTLAWPQVLMMILHFFISAVDVKVAGMINPSVQASLGMITQIFLFVLVIAMAVANSSVAAISQSVGAGLHSRVRRYILLCLVLGFILGFLLMLLSFPLRGILLKALQVNPEILPLTTYFLEVYLLITPFYYVLLISNAIFRAQKNVMQPLLTMGFITALNAIGDLGFGLGWFGFPVLGAKGLAWATFFSIIAGACLNIIQLWRQKSMSLTAFPPWRWIRYAAPYLFKVAWPAALTSAVWNSGYLLLFALTSSLPIGTNAANLALAGLTVGNRIESILFLPALAFNMTASILVGHWLGKGKPDVAKAFGYRILCIALVTVGGITWLLWYFLNPLVLYFAPEPNVLNESISYLRWNMLAIPFTVTSMLLGGALSGAGATILNLAIFGSAIWFVRLPLAWFLGHHTMQSSEGIWIAMFASQFAQAGIIFYIYHCYDWSRFSLIKRKQRNS